VIWRDPAVAEFASQLALLLLRLNINVFTASPTALQTFAGQGLGAFWGGIAGWSPICSPLAPWSLARSSRPDVAARAKRRWPRGDLPARCGSLASNTDDGSDAKFFAKTHSAVAVYLFSATRNEA
jgi:hypothetical protein